MNLAKSFNSLNNITFVVFIISAIFLALFDFKYYGDIFRFLVVPIFIILLINRDYKKFKILMIAFVIACGIAYLFKYGIAYIVVHFNMQNIFEFAKRPINGKFNGFPSGHTTSAFIAVAFAYNFYKLKWKILFLMLGLLVGISRIENLYHTPLQVFAGSILGFFVSLFIFRKFIKS